MSCATCLHANPMVDAPDFECRGAPPQVVEILKTAPVPKGTQIFDLGGKRFATVWPLVGPEDQCRAYVHKL
jgi:hypothetical protein